MMRIKTINNQIDRMMELKSVQNSSCVSELNILKDRLNDKTFRIVVVGEFSSGKSTFINSIIGKDILKHAATETTATVTYIYNVLENDKRINTCDIEYINGKKLHISDLEQLRMYTTVNSEIDVADTIRSVSIYVNFLKVLYPVMIADTPGLNGIADKHREITLDEIKKAHACIYLLSSGGVKSTDFDFINVLLNYQNRFIFIQNFIDLLRKNEGDTLQKKIDKDKENLNFCFKKRNNNVNYDIYGISAVKALASKDLAKTRVFDNDMYEISDRKKLYDESHYQDFENCLYKMIQSGDYLVSIENSAIHTLGYIIERIRKGLDEENEVSEQLRANDDKAKSIERAKKIISRINSQKDDRKKRLENFLISRDIENRKSLHEYIKSSLESLNESVKKDIDRNMKTYDQIVTFADYYNSEPPKYYGVYIANEINSVLIPEVDGRIQDNLSHLYDEALLRVSDFVTSVTKSGTKISININSTTSVFKENSIKANQEIYRTERDSKISQKESEEGHNKVLHEAKDDTEKEIRIENKMKDNDEKKQKESIEILGNDPGVKQKRVEKKKKKKRKGLFRIADFLFGEKTETYWAYEDDYTEQNEWKKRKAALEENGRRMRDRHLSRLNSLETKRKGIEDKIQVSEQKISRLEKDIAELEIRMKREEEIYESTLKANQDEYCENERRRLKEEIEKTLFDGTERQSVCESIIKHIDSVDLKNLPKIKEKVFEYFDESVNARLRNLSSLIEENEKELSSRYELNRKELDILADITANLNNKKQISQRR